VVQFRAYAQAMSERKKIPITFVVTAGQAPPTKEQVEAFFKTDDFTPDITTYWVTDLNYSGFIRADNYWQDYEVEDDTDE
jgi:hypothetical protein